MNKRQQAIKKSINSNKYAFILYMLSPMLSLFFSFRHFREPWAKNIVWLFTIFFGFTFYIASESSSDAVRYKDTLIEMSHSDLSAESLVNVFLSEDSKYIDIAQPLITFIVSRFTEDYRVLFAVFGLFFGYFYSRNIWYLINRSERRVNYLSGLLLFVFAFIVSIASINGLRFWTATHIFFFGMIPYVVEGRKKGLLVAASSVLVHFSFLLPLALLVIYVFAGNRLNLYFSIFILSFFISSLNTSMIMQVTSHLPKALQKKSDTYLNEDYVEEVGKNKAERSWFISLAPNAVSYTVALISIVVFAYPKRYLSRKSVFNLFCAGLLFYGFFNILSSLPSVGRFLSLSKMLLVGAIFWISVYHSDKLLKRLLFLSIPGLVLFLIIQIRILLDYSSYLLLVSNPVLAMFLKSDMGLFEFISKLYKS